MLSQNQYYQLEVLYHEHKDAAIAYRKLGTGEPLLMIHGWPVHGFTWRNVVSQLSEHYTCYILDMPGLGISEWQDTADFSWLMQARRVISLIMRLDLRDYSIIAHDSGGVIARLVALEIEEKHSLKKLILINSEIPHHRPPWIRIYRLFSYIPFSERLFRRLLQSRRFLRSSLGYGSLYVDKSLLDSSLFLSNYIEPLIISSRKLQGAIKYLKSMNFKIVDSFSEFHGKIQADVLLIWGIEDKTFPFNEGVKMVAQFKRCQLSVVKDASLMPHEEKPGAVVRHIANFLANNIEMEPRLL